LVYQLLRKECQKSRSVGRNRKEEKPAGSPAHFLKKRVQRTGWCKGGRGFLSSASAIGRTSGRACRNPLGHVGRGANIKEAIYIQEENYAAGEKVRQVVLRDFSPRLPPEAYGSDRAIKFEGGKLNREGEGKQRGHCVTGNRKKRWSAKMRLRRSCVYSIIAKRRVIKCAITREKPEPYERRTQKLTVKEGGLGPPHLSLTSFTKTRFSQRGVVQAPWVRKSGRKKLPNPKNFTFQIKKGTLACRRKGVSWVTAT